MLLKGDILANADTPVGELALQPAVCVADVSTLAEVAATMEQAKISAVLVGDTTLRIFTERDLTRALAARSGPDTRAIDAASPNVVVAAPNLPLGRAAASMVRRGIRHLPVVDAGGVVIGMLGLDAVFRILLREPDLSDWVAEFDGVVADGG